MNSPTNINVIDEGVRIVGVAAPVPPDVAPIGVCVPAALVAVVPLGAFVEEVGKSVVAGGSEVKQLAPFDPFPTVRMSVLPPLPRPLIIDDFEPEGIEPDS